MRAYTSLITVHLHARIAVTGAALWLLLPATASAQNVGINADGSAPHPSALLDVDAAALPFADKKGLLVPRMATAERNAIPTPATGLLVYDTGLNAFWYFDGTAWMPLGGGGGSGWLLTGNAGTMDGTHFLGTTDDVPLNFRVNGEHAGRIEAGFWANTFLGHGAGLNNTSLWNTAIGKLALSSGNTGMDNTAVGVQALRYNTAGSENTAQGYRALRDNSTGGGNTAQGAGALSSNTTGSSNAAQGVWALHLNTTGHYNTAIGTNALFTNIAGSHATAIGAGAMGFANNTATPFENTNVAVGYEALRGSVDPADNTGNGNTAVGYQALTGNATGGENTAIGLLSLSQNTTGGGNTALGHGALVSNTTGGGNTAIGSGALSTNVSGHYSTAVGMNAMLYAHNSLVPIFGNHGTAVGYEALRGSPDPAANTGLWNTAVGFRALMNNTSGGINAALGHYALFANTTGSGNTAVGEGALASNSTGGLNTSVGTGAGTIGDLSGTIAVGISAAAGTDYRAVIGTAAHTNLTGGFGAWQDLSDGRFKRHVREDVPGLDFITRLRPVTYTLDAHGVDAFLGIAQRMDTLPDDAGKAHYRQRLDAVAAERQTGFIAQDVEKAASQVGYPFSGVHRPASETDHYTLGYATFTVPIVKSVQELHAMVLEQQRVSGQLREEVEALREELRKLKEGR